MPAQFFLFTASVSAGSAEDAVSTVDRRLPDGFEATGRVSAKSERHGLWTVEIEADGDADRNDCWVVLTSYGISPSTDLGSCWESVLGASA